jgi:hypothetical protein
VRSIAVVTTKIPSRSLVAARHTYKEVGNRKEAPREAANMGAASVSAEGSDEVWQSLMTHKKEESGTATPEERKGRKSVHGGEF